MHRRFKQPDGTSIRLYALGAIFLVPLSIGVLLVSSNASQNDNAYQISHDVASMYAQGLKFSQRANQNIALSVADAKGIDVRGGKGVLILSNGALRLGKPGAACQLLWHARVRRSS